MVGFYTHFCGFWIPVRVLEALHLMHVAVFEHPDEKSEVVRATREAFMLGLLAAGETVQLTTDPRMPCDVAVLRGLRDQRFDRITSYREEVRRNHEHVLVISGGYLRRGEYFSVGWGGRDGAADFCNKDSPPDRWKALGLERKPWRDHGSVILVCSQAPTCPLPDDKFVRWEKETLAALDKLICVKNKSKFVEVRPHPRREWRPAFTECLKDVWCVVTHSSGCAIEAAIEGVPVVAADKFSMARPVAMRSVEDLNRRLRTPERQQWSWDLAYTQWTMEEMRSGEPWRRLRKGRFRT